MRDVAAVPNLLATPSASTRLANWNATRPHLSLAPSFFHWHDLIYVSRVRTNYSWLRCTARERPRNSDFITSKILQKNTASWDISK